MTIPRTKLVELRDSHTDGTPISDVIRAAWAHGYETGSGAKSVARNELNEKRKAVFAAFSAGYKRWAQATAYSFPPGSGKLAERAIREGTLDGFLLMERHDRARFVDAFFAWVDDAGLVGSFRAFVNNQSTIQKRTLNAARDAQRLPDLSERGAELRREFMGEDS